MLSSYADTHLNNHPIIVQQQNIIIENIVFCLQLTRGFSTTLSSFSMIVDCLGYNYTFFRVKEQCPCFLLLNCYLVQRCKTAEENNLPILLLKLMFMIGNTSLISFFPFSKYLGCHSAFTKFVMSCTNHSVKLSLSR